MSTLHEAWKHRAALLIIRDNLLEKEDGIATHPPKGWAREALIITGDFWYTANSALPALLGKVLFQVVVCHREE